VGCPIETYGLLDATLQVRKIEPWAPAADALLICNPNNPFGHVEESTSGLLDHRQGLTIVDEAYAEFAGPSEAIRRIRKGRDNVAVVRTFSKAFGAAGIRLGYLLGSPTLLQSLGAYRGARSAHRSHRDRQAPA
jgi:histidinol-phosphate aminotransferase